MLRCDRLAIVLLPVLCLLSLLSAGAQAPVALPFTITTLTGTGSTLITAAGAQCPNMGASFKSTTKYGDGCLAVNASLGASERGGVAVDAFGNVFVNDDIGGVLHMINPSSGIMTAIAGGNTNCAAGTAGAAGLIDLSGDGCTAATSTLSKTGMRGMGLDPYGNPLFSGYSDSLIHIVCRNPSPLCVAGTPSPTLSNPVQIPIGAMGLVAGCTAGTGAAGSAGVGLDNKPGFSIAVQSPYYYYSSGAGNIFFNSATCSTSLGEVDQPRGVTADLYGNVFYGDTTSNRFRVVLGPQTYNGIANPMWAVIGKNTAWTAKAGYAYTIAAGGNSLTPTSSGSSCGSGNAYGTTTDAWGDGCLFTYASLTTSTSYTQAIAVDAAGNVIYTDPAHGVHVLYVEDGTSAGFPTSSTSPAVIALAKMNSVLKAEGYGTPVTGYTYLLAGFSGTSGAGTLGTAPTLAGGASGTSITSQTADTKIAISPQGNIYIGDGTYILFIDMNTGYIRELLTAGSNLAKGTVCNANTTQTSLSAYSDGCPAANANFSNGSNGTSVAVDAQGNLYVQDATSVVRKILAQGLAEQSVGTTLTQTIMVHLPESAGTPGTISGATATVSATSDITAGTPSCTQNADFSVDCTVPVTATPSAVGLRSATLTVTLPTGSWTNPSQTIALGGVVTGSVLAADGVSTTTNSVTTPNPFNTSKIMKWTGFTPVGVALDGAGNVYSLDGSTGKIWESVQGGVAVQIGTLSGVSSQGQIAVDQLGDVFIANGGSRISELLVTGPPTTPGGPLSYTLTTIPVTTTSGTPSLVAVAVDQSGTLFVADATTQTVYRLTLASNALINETTVASGFSQISKIGVDNQGNVAIGDTGAGTAYEYAPGATGSYSLQGTLSSILPSVAPTQIGIDPANDIYMVDKTTGLLYMLPANGNPFTLYSSSTTLTINGMAVDGQGSIYLADTLNGQIVKLVRDVATCNFGTEFSSATTTCNATLTNAGNMASTGSTSSANFTLTGCGLSGSSNASIEPLTRGMTCSLVATLAGTNSGYSFTLSPAPTLGSLTMSGILAVPTYDTTASLMETDSSTPIFGSSTGANFQVTVTPNNGTGITYGGTSAPTGTLTVWVDGASTSTTVATSSVNNSGVISLVGTFSLTSLTAGAHNVYVAYSGGSADSGGTVFVASTTNTLPVSIAQAPTGTTWTPSTAALTQQVSAALGTSGVLQPGISPNIPGYYAYAATCTSTSGNAACAAYAGTVVDASTYLPIGTYSLTATFYPNDTTDYANSTATVTGYTVTKATTTAAVGVSTNVVAADGSGNYTTLTAALQALPATGGAIYIRPGTYSGQNAISYPNVQLRGLGGNAANVILTGANGNFTSVYPPFTLGPAGKGGDEGSAVLDVSKNGYMGTTATGASTLPTGFYAENLSIQNTFDTDPNTTWNVTASGNGGTCNSPGATAYSLQYLYNNNMECGSQALAMYIAADQSILNNVTLTSQQDTLEAQSQGSSGSIYFPARQYMWKGWITGDVDYVFGDGALVFDHTNFFTTLHVNLSNNTTLTGSESIEAQSKQAQTGSPNDYLSGFVCNGCTMMSQIPGMTNLYYGRPWKTYSTFILLNSFVDQVNNCGWYGWTDSNCTTPASDFGDANLTTSTYAEFGTQAISDANIGFYPTSLFGGQMTTGTPAQCSGTTAYQYICGGNTGSGATNFSLRETTSLDPGTIEASNASRTQLSAGQAAQYYPVNFLNSTVPSAELTAYSNMPSTWNPVNALTAQVNAFVPVSSVGTLNYGSSVTLLGRPQTPGAGVIPTGTYAFYDSLTGATCTTASAGCATLASGTLDASGEAYLTTSTLAGGATHTITMVYGGDANFAASTSSTYAITVNAPPTVATTTILTVGNAAITYGGLLAGTVTVTPASGTAPSGEAVSLYSGATKLGSCTLSSGSCSYSLSNVAVASSGTLTAVYSGDSSFAGSTSNGVSFSVARANLTVTANSLSMIVGGTVPAFTYTPSGFVSPDTSAVLSGAPAMSIGAANTTIEGSYPITITVGTLTAANYSFAFVNGTLSVVGTPAVATGDNRTVTEPSFPAVCQQLSAAIASVNNDIPTVVDATVTNPDGARIQAALTACSGTGKAVELSASGLNNAFLSGPLSMPANVTLLVDPGVTLFFSRNAADYNIGSAVCGTINANTATNSCLPLIDIPKHSTNVAIMGYGKLDGRGGDPLLNGSATGGNAPPATYSWWNLSAQANGEGNQQNPRFIQLESGGSNLTLYKITLLNSPLFHISTTGTFSNFTAWDIKIVTPTSARNTDGIDPGNATNFTINKSWISDGDDNIAVGASGTGTSNASSNISVTNNHFFAGHGESIGSYTSAGVINVLFDNNMLWGNSSVDGNSTGIRIKSANDRGGIVSQIQYSNSCFQNHNTEIQFTPLYNSNSGSATPNFNNILLQNLTFLTAGQVQFTGANNNGTINPLMVTLDNVGFNTLSTYNFVTSGSEGTETNAQLSFGPGFVSNNFVTAWTGSFAGSNGDTVTNNIAATALTPPTCNFTKIAPELTGPAGLAQTISQGQVATAVVILTPAMSSAGASSGTATTYPTGTVTLTDSFNSSTYTGTLSGSSDTLSIPLTGLAVGAHTFTASYAGDSNYSIPAADQNFGSYLVTVNASTGASTTTVLSGVPSTTSYSTPITATATVTGVNPTGSVQFLVNGAVFATVALTPGTTTSTASVNLTLATSATPYSIQAIYSGDSANAVSTSTAASMTVTQATPVISWATPAAITYGTALSATQLNATATFGGSSVAGTFNYTPASGTVLHAGSGQTLSVTFTPADSTDFATPAAATTTITVNQALPVLSWATPVAITYGTALSATQLNATAAFGGSTVAGTFTYTPAAGTVLRAGSGQTLSVTFAPTDATDYATPAAATTTITVNQATPVITWATPAAITYGTALSATQLNATAAFGGSNVAGTFTYTPASGVILKAGSGQTLSVTFAPTDTTDYATPAATTTTITVNQATPVITWATPTAITYGTALSATQLNATAAFGGSNVAGTFTYTPAAGTVLKAGSGQTLSVTFAPTDTTDYATPAATTTTITVNQATPVITWATPTAITYGTALSATQLNATAAFGGSNVAGTFTYTPAAGTVLKAGSGQTLSVTFAPTDATDYATPAAATTTITVNQALPVVSWATPAAITYGTALSATQLNATAAFGGSAVAGTFTYTPAAGAVLKAGTGQTLSVTFAPTDSTDYATPAAATTTITVNQALPVLTWATPAAITYGTALSTTQLDATAAFGGSAVAGTFTYTPASGTVLKAGSGQTLSVTFAPTDAIDYATPAAATTTITVNQATPVLTWPTPAAIYYGTALSSTQLNATAAFGGSAVAGTFTYTPAAGAVLAVGAQTLSVSFAPTDTLDYTSATGSVKLTVNPPPVTPTVTVTSNSNPALLGSAATLTATLTFTSSNTPTGTVTFLDGTTTLGTGSVAKNMATYTSSALATGAHSITAVYGGDSNFNPATSAALTETVVAITLGSPAPGTGSTGTGSGATQTVSPGGTAAFSLPILPSSGSSFPVALTMTVTGLPTGAVATVTPSAWVAAASNTSASSSWLLAANTALGGNTLLSIQLPPATVAMQQNRGADRILAARMAPLALALLLLPFAGRLRRTGKRLGRLLPLLLLLAAGMATIGGVSGCGGSGSGFFTQPQQTYSVTVTVSAGSQSQSSTLSLTVQ